MLHLQVVHRIDDYIAVRDGSGHKRYSTEFRTIELERATRLRSSKIVPEFSMDLVVILDQLREARQFVTDGEQCILGQRKIVEWLERKGCDTLEAILFLNTSKRCRTSTWRIGIGWSDESCAGTT